MTAAYLFARSVCIVLHFNFVDATEECTRYVYTWLSCIRRREQCVAEVSVAALLGLGIYVNTENLVVEGFSTPGFIVVLVD